MCVRDFCVYAADVKPVGLCLSELNISVMINAKMYAATYILKVTHITH